MGDPKLHPGGVNIGDLDMGCLGEAQTASEDGHECPFGKHAKGLKSG